MFSNRYTCYFGAIASGLLAFYCSVIHDADFRSVPVLATEVELPAEPDIQGFSGTAERQLRDAVALCYVVFGADVDEDGHGIAQTLLTTPIRPLSTDHVGPQGGTVNFTSGELALNPDMQGIELALGCLVGAGHIHHDHNYSREPTRLAQLERVTYYNRLASDKAIRQAEKIYDWILANQSHAFWSLEWLADLKKGVLTNKYNAVLYGIQGDFLYLMTQARRIADEGDSSLRAATEVFNSARDFGALDDPKQLTANFDRTTARLLNGFDKLTRILEERTHGAHADRRAEAKARIRRYRALAEFYRHYRGEVERASIDELMAL